MHKAQRESMYSFLSLLAGQYGSMACSMIFTFVIARFLVPSDFGSFTVGVFSLDLFNALTEWGWEQGIFKASNQDYQRACSNHLLVRIVLGFLPCFGIICMKMVGYFQDTRIFYAALLLALATCFERVGLTYKTILERAYALRTLAKYEFGSMIASYLCALAFLWSGGGVFVLVIQRCAERLFLLIGYFRASPWKGLPGLDMRLFRAWIQNFGFATWSSGILSMFLYDFMATFVGLRSGMHSAGLYARSFKMATMPLMVTAVTQRMATPLYASHHGDKQELKSIFVRYQAYKLLLILPVQSFLIAAASFWIPAVLGEQWRDAVLLYRILAVYGLLRAFYDDVPSLFLYGLAQPWILFQQHLVQSCAMIFASLVSSFWFSGALAGAFTTALAMMGAVSVLWGRAIGLFGITLRDFFAEYRLLFLLVRGTLQPSSNFGVKGATVVHERVKNTSRGRTIQQ